MKNIKIVLLMVAVVMGMFVVGCGDDDLKAAKGEYVNAASKETLKILSDAIEEQNASSSEGRTIISDLVVVNTRQDNKKEPVRVWIIAKINYTDPGHPDGGEEYFPILWEVEYDDNYKNFRCVPVATLYVRGSYKEAVEDLPAPGKEVRNGICW